MTMTRLDDAAEPELECPTCGRDFHSYARLEDHMEEHGAERSCKQCGVQLHRTVYHRC